MIDSMLKSVDKNKEFLWLDRGCFHALLPYESYDEESGLFCNKDSTGFVLKGPSLVGASLADQKKLAEFLRQQELFPEGSSFQVLLVASPRVESILDYWANYRQEGIYQTLAQKRKSLFMDKAAGKAPPPVFTYYLLISLSFPRCVTIRAEQEGILQARDALQQALKAIGMVTHSLDGEEFVQEMVNLLNITGSLKNEPYSWDQEESISKQVLHSDQNFEIHEEGVYSNKRKTLWRSYIPKRSPKVWALPHMDRFLGEILSLDGGMLCPFWLHYGFTIDQNQSRARGKVMVKRESLDNAMKNKLTKWIGGLPEQYKEADDCLDELNQGERVVLANLSLTIMTSPENLSKVESRLRQIWNVAGWEAGPTTFDHLPMMLSSLPMTWTMGVGKKFWQITEEVQGFGRDLSVMGKAKKTITREAQNLLPILAEWKGQAAPGMLLYGRRGQPFMWNPFSTALLPNAQDVQTHHNYNVCIAGQSGSGKSVFMQDLMVSVLGIGGRVFVLDYGRSFKKSCYLLGGQYIEFDLRNPISLNPFSNIPLGETGEEKETRDEFISNLKVILKAMVDPDGSTSRLETAALAQAIREVWDEYKQEGTIDHIQKSLKAREESYARDLGSMLFNFTTKGDYGGFFNSPSEANLNSDLVVIETDHLRNQPDLMTVLIQIMILQINQTMARGDRQRPFLIIIDEAWKLLKGKETAAFMGDVARTARKYKGGLVLGTQHLKDYFNGEIPATREVFDCSTWKCLLYQETDALKALRGHEQLSEFLGTEFQESLLCSLRSSPPHYSEVAIFGAGLKGVIGRLSLDPFSRLLYSTNPEEYTAVENEMKNGLPVLEAIENVLKQKGS